MLTLNSVKIVSHDLAQTSHHQPLYFCRCSGSTTKSVKKSSTFCWTIGLYGISSVIGIDYLVVYPEWFSRRSNTSQRSLERDAILIEEGTRPLQYWVYEQDTDAEQQPELSDESSLSSVTLDLWTSKDYASPILMLGEGILQESKLSPGEQFNRHRFQLDTPRLSMPMRFKIAMVLSFGMMFSISIPIDDHIVIREGEVSKWSCLSWILLMSTRMLVASTPAVWWCVVDDWSSAGWWVGEMRIRRWNHVLY